MSYENAPATRLVATHCACCGRDLVDAQSVEAGVGPVCRRTHGYATAEGPADWPAIDAATAALDLDPAAREPIAHRDAHAAANRLTHRAALAQGTPRAADLAGVVALLGYPTLASRIATHAGAARFVAEGGELVLTAPYSRDVLAALRRTDARTRWDRAARVRRLAPEALPAVLWALREGLGAATAVVLADGRVARLGDVAPAEAPAAPRREREPLPPTPARGDRVTVRRGREAGLAGTVGWVGAGRDGSPRLGIRPDGQRRGRYTFVALWQLAPVAEAAAA